MFAWVTWSNQVIGSVLIGALKNNQIKIWTMHFFSSWFVWFGLFALFALLTKKETHPVIVFFRYFYSSMGSVQQLTEYSRVRYRQCLGNGWKSIPYSLMLTNFFLFQPKILLVCIKTNSNVESLYSLTHNKKHLSRWDLRVHWTMSHTWFICKSGLDCSWLTDTCTYIAILSSHKSQTPKLNVFKYLFY